MQAGFLDLTSGFRVKIEEKYNKNELVCGYTCTVRGRVVDPH
jgi:hypothetical protein